MSAAARDFVIHAMEGKVTNNVPKVTMDGQTTITKMCAECGEMMPHVVGAKSCILCEMCGPEEEEG